MGSIMFGGNFPLAANEPHKPEAVLEQAKSFLDQYFTSIRRYVIFIFLIRDWKMILYTYIFYMDFNLTHAIENHRQKNH